MRLESVTAEIRPRSDWEAVDLGFAMVRRDFWRCLMVWWLAMAVPLMVAGTLLWRHPLWLMALFWWFKPVASRLVLFEISRRLFGEQPPWKSVLREIPRAWTRRFAYRFLWARFSPWQPVTLAVEDLEGLRGNSYRLRSRQLLRRGEGAVMWIYFLADLSAGWLAVGILGMAMMFIPDGQGSLWKDAMESWDSQSPFQIPLIISWTATVCVMLAISLTDLFVTGAGFGIYLNNRTWIEGWDVELAFKRLAQRLGKVAVILLACCLTGLVHGAEDTRTPAEVIAEVKSDKVFIVHTVTERVPKGSPKLDGWQLPGEWFGGVMQLIGLLGVAVLIMGLVWVVWKYRHVFRVGGGIPISKKPSSPPVRVVMGMDVSPDTLPADIPATAWALWQQGRHHEAMAMLYRGAISRVVEIARVEIQESDTEADCMRRVKEAGSVAHPDYFRGVTGAWSQLAYAGVNPAEAEVRVLCEQWPFGGGRPR